jgi:hypothetical protein
MSQGKQSLYIVSKNSGYLDYIIRPLSARLLPETRPEREGKVDRMRLLAIQGRGRKVQMELAARYGISDYPPPAGGCLLTDPIFSRRLRDLFQSVTDPSPRHIELLKFGRHFRLGSGKKIIVGRNIKDNQAIEKWQQGEDDLLHLSKLPGPSVLIPGGGTVEEREMAARLCALYAGMPEDRYVDIICRSGDQTYHLSVQSLERETAARLII